MKTLSEDENVYIYENKTGNAPALDISWDWTDIPYRTYGQEKTRSVGKRHNNRNPALSARQNWTAFLGGIFYLKPEDLSVTVRKEEELELKFP